MSPLVKSVGVYSLEQDQSQYQPASSPLNPAIVLYAGWGDYDVIKIVTSVSELYVNFGEAPTSAYLGLIGMKKYFRYGSSLKVVRAKGVSDAYAVYTFNAVSAPSLKVQALWKGMFGNKVAVKISTGADAKKQIEVYVNNRLVETYKSLEKATGSDKNANYKTAINGVSAWITIATDSTADAETLEPSTIEATFLAGGVSSLPTKAAFIGTATGGPNSGPSGLQCFATDSVLINVLLCPDSASLASETDAKDVSKELESIAESRRDSVVLVDFPAGKSRDNAVTYADTTAGWNSTYVAAYWPWFQVSEAAIAANAYIPASCGALIAFAKNDVLQYPWFAPMGYNGRGNITEALAVEYNTSRADRDIIQGSNINTLVQEPGVGVVILGNKTKYSVSQATQSLNIRRGLLFIELALATGCKFLIGEPNDAITRAQLKSMADKVLAEVKAKRGLDSFLVICDETNNPTPIVDQKKLVATIKLQPTKAVEVIELTFQITQSGAKFDE